MPYRLWVVRLKFALFVQFALSMNYPYKTLQSRKPFASVRVNFPMALARTGVSPIPILTMRFRSAAAADTTT